MTLKIYAMPDNCSMNFAKLKTALEQTFLGIPGKSINGLQVAYQSALVKGCSFAAYAGFDAKS